MDGDYEDSELETPIRKEKKRVSFPSTKQFGGKKKTPPYCQLEEENLKRHV